MKIVAALTDPTQAAQAVQQGADLVELRIDLYEGDLVQQVRSARAACPLPVIVTLRSAQEGGRFFGTAGEWMKKIEPLVPFADYIDIEQPFAQHAPAIRQAGKKIIASHHPGGMLPLPDLFMLERELRAYGDIPKIVVTPRDDADLVELLTFTQAANKPIVTGVMGSRFRYGRAVLPLFGSEFVYCHTGTRPQKGSTRLRNSYS